MTDASEGSTACHVPNYNKLDNCSDKNLPGSCPVAALDRLPCGHF